MMQSLLSRTRRVGLLVLPVTGALALVLSALFASSQSQYGPTAVGGTSTVAAIAQLDTPGRYRFSIRTETLPTLAPHKHQLHRDSVTDQGHGITISSPTVIVPEDMWVVRYHTIIHNAPYTSVHHSGLWRLDEKHPICPEIVQGRHVYVAANDVAQAPIEFPEPYGMFLPKGTPLIFQVMLHNALPPIGPGDRYANVWVEVVLDFEKPTATARSKPLEFYQLALEDEPCDPTDSVFTVPANAGNYTKTSAPTDNARYTFQQNGLIVAMGNHLHAWAGGQHVDVFLNNSPIVSFSTQRSSPEPWSWFSPRLFPFLWVEAGDTISIAATYENRDDTPIRGAMGMIGFYFSPNDPGLMPVTKP